MAHDKRGNGNRRQDRIRVAGLSGSLSSESTSLAALKVALSGASEAGAITQLLDVRSLKLPMYDPTESHIPRVAQDFAEAVYAADGMIWSSPLYNGSISGVFKNAIDWLHLLMEREPPFLTDKVIGLISTAGGVQGLQAINTMEFIARSLRGWAVPLVMPIAQSWQAFDQQGNLVDKAVEEQLRAVGKEVVRAARQFAADGICDYSERQQRGLEVAARRL